MRPKIGFKARKPALILRISFQKTPLPWATVDSAREAFPFQFWPVSVSHRLDMSISRTDPFPFRTTRNWVGVPAL